MAESKLDKLLDQLNDDNPKVRRKACKKLGDLGDPNAIIELSSIYRREDEDPRVKAAAQKALEKFAAQESGGSNIKGWLRLVTRLLVASLVVLLALNAILRLSGGESEDSGTEVVQQPTPSNRDALLNNLTNNIVLPMLSNVNLLREEFNAGAGEIPCTAQLQAVPLVTMSDVDRIAYQDIELVVDVLMGAETTLDEVVATWEQICQSPAGERGTSEQVDEALGQLSQVESDLMTAADAIVYAQENPPVVATQEASPMAATAEVTATADTQPTEEVTATPRIINARVLRDLNRIIGNTESALNTLINNQWSYVEQGQDSPFGCSVAPIEDAYSLPEDIAQQDPELATAIQILNEGLAQAQASSDAYAAACQASSFTPEVVEQGIADAEGAQEKMTIVSDFLNQYQGEQ